MDLTAYPIIRDVISNVQILKDDIKGLQNSENRNAANVTSIAMRSLALLAGAYLSTRLTIATFKFVASSFVGAIKAAATVSVIALCCKVLHPSKAASIQNAFSRFFFPTKVETSAPQVSPRTPAATKPQEPTPTVPVIASQTVVPVIVTTEVTTPTATT